MCEFPRRQRLVELGGLDLAGRIMRRLDPCATVPRGRSQPGVIWSMDLNAGCELMIVIFSNRRQAVRYSFWI